MNIIYAPNINSGGGKVLLEAAITSNHFGVIKKLYIDTRCDLDFESLKSLEVIKVKPNILSRFLAQLNLKYFCRSNKIEKVVFFGNMPPFFKIQSQCVVFLQNAYILKSTPLPKKLKPKIRTIVEKILFYTFINQETQIMVQTNWMKESLATESNLDSIITHLLPKLPLKQSVQNQFDVIAITGPEVHKNQKLLLNSLNSLNSKARVCIISPSAITIKNKKIDLTHYKHCERDLLFKLISASNSILVLSQFESLCLPLYEGKHFGLKLIAPLKGYITEQIKPDYVIKKLNTKNVKKSIEQLLEDLSGKKQT